MKKAEVGGYIEWESEFDACNDLPSESVAACMTSTILLNPATLIGNGRSIVSGYETGMKKTAARYSRSLSPRKKDVLQLRTILLLRKCPFFVLQSYKLNHFGKLERRRREYKRIKNLHFSFPSVCIKVPSGKSIRKKGNPPFANVLI
jgi:hypothetical protein